MVRMVASFGLIVFIDLVACFTPNVATLLPRHGGGEKKRKKTFLLSAVVGLYRADRRSEIWEDMNLVALNVRWENESGLFLH